jgi:hypothetical protein
LIQVEFWVLVACILAAAGGEVRGQQTSPGADETAEVLFQRAVRETASAGFRSAVELLERAALVTSDPQLLGRIQLYLGINHAVLGAPARSRQAFRAALTHNPLLELDPARIKQDVVDLFQEVRRGMLGQLVVQGTPEGAEVRVDGERGGWVPYQGWLPVGRHRVEVRSSDGKHVFRQEVVLHLDKRVDLRVALRARPSDPPVVAQFNPTPRSVPDRGPRRIWTWVSATGTVVTLAAAIILILSAKSDYDEYWATETSAAMGKELAETIEAKSLGSYVLFGVSGALAAATAVAYYLEGRRGTGRGIDTVQTDEGVVVPLMGPVQGIMVRGRF